MAGTAKEQIGVDLPDPPDAPAIEIDDQVSDEPSRPEWLPEKFKDEAEFANSYKNLEDELRRRAESERRMEAQIAQLAEIVEQSQYQQPQVQQPQGIDPGFKAQLMESFENDPVGTMAYLAQQYSDHAIEQKLASLQEENTPIAQQQMEMQNQMLAMTVDRALGERYNDWGEYKERIAREIEMDGSLLPPQVLSNPESTIRSLSRIYENVKARDIIEQSQNGGNFAADQMKRQAQTLAGTTGRPGEPSPEDEKFARLLAASKGMSYSAWRSG